MTPQIATPDAQDRAEVLDETHLTPDGEDIANFDGLPKVYDATAKPEDSEPEDRPIDDVERNNDPHVEKQLDKSLKETFPASDPVSINPGAD
jgi:hypothetical protein